MENLYILINNNYDLIDEKIVEKYELTKGTLSPYTRSPIVNEQGEYYKENKENEEEKPDLSNPDDGVDEMENGLSLSTSEILDIAQGVDSDMTS